MNSADETSLPCPCSPPQREHHASLLEAGEVACHPLVIGELACGSLRERQEILDLLSALPQAVHTADDRILPFIDTHRLHGQGIGLIDVHLVYAAVTERRSSWSRIHLPEGPSREEDISFAMSIDPSAATERPRTALASGPRRRLTGDRQRRAWPPRRG